MPDPRNDAVAPNQENLHFPSLTFPTNDELDGHSMTLSVIRYRYRSRSNTNRKKDTLGTITLPLPENLPTTYGARYNNEPLGVVGKIGAEHGPDVIKAFEEDGISGGRQALKDKILSVEKKELTDALLAVGYQFAESEVGGLVGAFLGGVGGGLAAISAQQAFQGVSAGVGIARNPHEAVLFQGMDFRTHSFDYKLVPKNREDSDTIRDVIYRLKQGLLPTYLSSNHFFSYPHLFEIRFSSSVRDYLFDIGPSFLTNLTIDYHGEGLAQYARDSATGARAPHKHQPEHELRGGHHRHQRGHPPRRRRSIAA